MFGSYSLTNEKKSGHALKRIIVASVWICSVSSSNKQAWVSSIANNDDNDANNPNQKNVVENFWSFPTKADHRNDPNAVSHHVRTKGDTNEKVGNVGIHRRRRDQHHHHRRTTTNREPFHIFDPATGTGFTGGDALAELHAHHLTNDHPPLLTTVTLQIKYVHGTMSSSQGSLLEKKVLSFLEDRISPPSSSSSSSGTVEGNEASPYPFRHGGTEGPSVHVVDVNLSNQTLVRHHGHSHGQGHSSGSSSMVSGGGGGGGDVYVLVADLLVIGSESGMAALSVRSPSKVEVTQFHTMIESSVSDYAEFLALDIHYLVDVDTYFRDVFEVAMMPVEAAAAVPSSVDPAQAHAPVVVVVASNNQTQVPEPTQGHRPQDVVTIIDEDPPELSNTNNNNHHKDQSQPQNKHNRTSAVSMVHYVSALTKHSTEWVNNQRTKINFQPSSPGFITIIAIAATVTLLGLILCVRRIVKRRHYHRTLLADARNHADRVAASLRRTQSSSSSSVTSATSSSSARSRKLLRPIPVRPKKDRDRVSLRKETGLDEDTYRMKSTLQHFAKGTSPLLMLDSFRRKRFPSSSSDPPLNHHSRLGMSSPEHRKLLTATLNPFDDDNDRPDNKDGQEHPSSSLSSSQQLRESPTKGDDHAYEAQVRTCYAPAGKLGVAIDSVGGVAVVHRVKEGSPLEGILSHLDRIVRIDDDSTDGMTAAEVTRLMVRKMNKSRKIHYIRKLRHMGEMA